MSEVAALAAIATLGEAGAAQFDPLRWHHLEALARRSAAYHGEVRRLLDDKLARALAELQADFLRAQSQAREGTAIGEPRPQESPLGELLRYIERCSAASGEPVGSLPQGAHGELKAIRHFRNTWARLSVSKQVAAAIDQAPENAGPLNSHFLVLRSLMRMRELSPDYLNRFMSYADTLLCLEQAEKQGKPTAKKTTAADGAKKRSKKPAAPAA